MYARIGKARKGDGYAVDQKEPDNLDENRRDYDRYPTDAEVDVRGRSQEDNPFCNQARLSDISGEGACLLTKHPEFYSQGQDLLVRIRLPDTDQLESFICCEASVRWILSSERLNEKNDPVSIGIHLHEHRTLESRKRASVLPEEQPESPS